MYARREVVADEISKESGHEDPSHQHHHHEGDEHHHAEHHHLEGERHHHEEHHPRSQSEPRLSPHHHHHPAGASEGMPFMSMSSSGGQGGMKKSAGGGLGREPATGSGEHLIEGRSPRIISDESEDSGIPPLAS